MTPLARLRAVVFAFVLSTSTFAADWPLTGAIGIHDPAIIKENNTWWAFATGVGAPVKYSSDGLAWTQGTPLFSAELSWWRTWAPTMGTNDVWAPDIHQFAGRYWCYYCVSEFGKNNSAIGLKSCTSIAAGDWRDDGFVLGTKAGINTYNAIDPFLAIDAAGTPWLAFGSWFSGIQIVRLDPLTMKPAAGAAVTALANRSGGIEAANIVYANGYYYLFVSIDVCCSGVNSTYKIACGRATAITGPYTNATGNAMLSGAFTLLELGDPTTRWRGPGGQTVYQNGNGWVIARHSYDALSNGAPMLRICDLYWDANGWPTYAAPTLPNQTATNGRDVSFVAPASITYQWQLSINGGSTWTNLTNTATYSGATADTLKISSTTLLMNGYQYRVLTGGGATVSNALTLAVGPVQFPSPVSIAVDASGNLYVSDSTDHTIQKVSATGIATAFLGTTGLLGSTDGTGAAALFRSPTGLALDSSGNLYIADTGNSTVRKATSAGVVTILAGSASASGAIDATGTAARFAAPTDLAVNSARIGFVADTGNHTIRKIDTQGAVTTLAGSAGTIFHADGTGGAAGFNGPAGISVNATTGDLFVGDTGNDTLRKVTSSGVVTTLAGTYGVAGSTDGAGSAALFSGLLGTTVDGSGNIYVADTQNSTIRKITPAGVTTTFAGTPGLAGLKDGVGGSAWFNKPRDVTTDASGNLYVADTGNAALRKITPAGVVTTVSVNVAPNPIGSSSGASSSGSTSSGSTTDSSSSGKKGGAPSISYFALLLAVGTLRRLRAGR